MSVERLRIASRYRWRLESSVEPATPEELLGVLLKLRGVAAHDAASFLDPPYATALHDPFLLPHCGAVVARLRRAVAAHADVAIFGDYDVDGITSTVLLAETLERLGARVRMALPHREEGYGLSPDAVRKLVPPATLLITVDNGASATDAVQEAIARGAEVVILDHHRLQRALPAGALIVHPALPASSYPNPHLAAVGVTWKVAAALLAEEGRAGEEVSLLDLVVLGTIADSVTLVGENRTLVTWGLEVLRRTRRPGLQLLAEQAGLSLSSLRAEDVTFRLVPRLNAAGRLRHAQLALDLLRAADHGTARRLALEVDAVNAERRQLTDDLFSTVTATLTPLLPPILFAAGPWPVGIVGVLASRLAEEYQRPAVVVAVRDTLCTASMRGDGVDVVELLRDAENLFTRFGGHAGAAGFSFPRSALSAVEAFFRAHPPLAVAADVAELSLDCALSLRGLSAEHALTLQRLEPFGRGNERPVFLLPRAVVVERRAVGDRGQHLRFAFRDHAGITGTAGVAFRWGERPVPDIGEVVDLATEIHLDTFRGIPRADLHVRDLRSAV